MRKIGLFLFIFTVLLTSFATHAAEVADRPSRRNVHSCADTVRGRFIEPREKDQQRGYCNTDEEDCQRRSDDDIDGRDDDQRGGGYDQGGGDARDPGDF